MKQRQLKDERSARIRNEASEWFVAFCEDELDGAGCDAFDRWLRDSADHVRAYLRISAIWQNADVLNHGAPIAIPSARVPAWSGRGWRIAACLTIALAAVGATWWRFSQPRSYATAAAERRTILLPDGSNVELNAKSKIQIEFSSAERGVSLTEGQALFSVLKNAQRPFVVRVGEVRVRAVGTRFDVYRKPAEATITVVEGQVVVIAAVSATGNQTIPTLMVSAGEQAKLGPRSPGIAYKTNVAAATSWTQGMLTFDSTPLAQVMEEYNRTGSRRLVIEDPNLLKFHISGVFPADDPWNVVKFLQQRFAIVIEATPEAIRINPPAKN
jgi:transmembrane sensor